MATVQFLLSSTDRLGATARMGREAGSCLRWFMRRRYRVWLEWKLSPLMWDYEPANARRSSDVLRTASALPPLRTSVVPVLGGDQVEGDLQGRRPQFLVGRFDVRYRGVRLVQRVEGERRP